jgi:hypothetical protein
MVRMHDVVCVAEHDDGEEVRVCCDYLEVYFAAVDGNLPYFTTGRPQISLTDF